jgi:NAD(P)-dependent dehydrogenase (short-subunit alcohol dehydrogenase family)
MLEKVVVITGATSGIGRVAGERLAAQGARIIVVARDQSRSVARLRTIAPNIAHRAHLAKLLSLAETRQVGDRIAAEEPRIDVLINNAGSIFSNRAVTVDGLERTFALNHMAYFVLTHRLRECLIASAPARIVNKASSTHQGQYLDFNDLQMEKHYRARTAYGRSKLANILCSRAN